MSRFALALLAVLVLAARPTFAQALGFGQATSQGRSQAAGAGIELPTLGQQNQPQNAPSSAFTDLLQQPVTTDPFAGRSDPRAAQAQAGGAPAGARTGFGGTTGFGRAGITAGARVGGGFRTGRLGRQGLGRQNMASNRPSFVVRLAPVVASLAPPPSIRELGGYVPPRQIPPVVASVQRIRGIRTVDVEISNGVAVLRGVAENEEARRLAELVVRLEPGVRQVRNEIQVVAATITPSVQ